MVLGFIPILALPVLVTAVVVDLILAYIVYRSNPDSATSRVFGLLGVSIVLWTVAMYLATSPLIEQYGLLLSRLTLVLATPMNLAFFLLAATLPASRIGISRRALWTLILLAAVIIGLVLSPLGFSDATVVNGRLETTAGPGLAVFGLFSIFLNLSAVIVLFRKLRRAEGPERPQLRLVMMGILIMFGLIVATIFIPVLVAQNTVLVVFAPLYTLIFLGMTAYAIVRHHLFNIKVIATEALTITLCVVLFSKIATAQSLEERFVDALILVVVLIFGIFLVRSVRREVAQREQLEVLTKKLEEANAHLIDLSRFKSQLLSLASHQIKSPLAIIKGYLTILLDGLYGPVDGKVRATLEKIKQSADGLTALIENLLNLRKAEEGRMDYRFAPVDISKIVEGIVETFRVMAYQKGLLLDYQAPATPVIAEADTDKIHEVFQNLLDNSIKYTPKGFVRVTVESVGGKARFSVKDSGIGMSAELLPRLFGEFVRDERVQKTIKGTGFGLYVAKKIVDAHGGKVWAESEGEGKGSAFVVELPLSQAK